MKSNLIKLALAIIFISMVLGQAMPSALAQQLTYPAEQTANQFTSTNQFMLGVQFGPVTFSNLPASPANGTIDWCSNCTLNSNPCTASGTGSFAYYQNGVWSCTGGGGGGGGSISLILGTTNEITITGGSGPTTTLFLANPLITPGAVTVTGGLTATGVTDSGLTPGNCVQASTGGLLVTIVGACGTSSGTITATGSPSSGELTKFSGGTSITNGNLSGDVTTSNTLVTTVVNVNGVSYPASPSTNKVPIVTGSNVVTYEIVPPAAGGTGIGNSATLTLGTSNINFALLGTGIVKNTTITGALTLAASSDVIALWSGTCNSSTFLNGAGACASGGSGSSALSSITAATGANIIANGNNGGQVWNWAQTSPSQAAFTFSETSAATGANDLEVVIQTLAGSTAIPLTVINSLNGSQTLCALCITPTWNTSGVVDAALLVNVTNASSAPGSLLADFQLNSVSQWNVTKAGQTTQLGNANVASDGVHAAAIDLLGLTTIPTFNGNSFAWIGPNSASFTSWGIQMSSTSPSVSSLFRLGAAVSGGGGLVSQGGTIPIQGTDASILSSGTISASTGIVLCTDANGGATTSGCSGISTSWSSMTNPTANLALSMGTNTSSFTSGDYGASPVTGVFNLTTSATSSTDTSYEFTITAPSTSYHNPLAVFVDNLTMWQICNLSSSHFGVSVVGNAVACNSINTSPLAKLIVEGTTITNLTLQREWMAPNTAVGDMNEWNTATPSGTGFYFLKGYAGVTSTDTSNGGGSLIFSIRGDGLFTGSFSGPGALANLIEGQSAVGGLTSTAATSSPDFVRVSSYCQSTTTCNPGSGITDESHAIAAIESAYNGSVNIIDDMCGLQYWSEQPFTKPGQMLLWSNCGSSSSHIIDLDGVASITLPSAFTLRGMGADGQSISSGVANTHIRVCNPAIETCPNSGFVTQNSSATTITTTVSTNTMTVTLAAGAPFTTCPATGICQTNTSVNAVQTGRQLCIYGSSIANNNGCWFYDTTVSYTAPQSFTVWVVNGVTTPCASSCGTVVLLQPMIAIGKGGGTPNNYHTVAENLSLDGSYLPGVECAANGQGEEGTGFRGIQFWNCVGGYIHLAEDNSYGGGATGAANSGNYGDLAGNLALVDCRISGGCACQQPLTASVTYTNTGHTVTWVSGAQFPYNIQTVSLSGTTGGPFSVLSVNASGTTLTYTGTASPASGSATATLTNTGMTACAANSTAGITPFGDDMGCGNGGATGTGPGGNEIVASGGGDPCANPNVAGYSLTSYTSGNQGFGDIANHFTCSFADKSNSSAGHFTPQFAGSGATQGACLRVIGVHAHFEDYHAEYLNFGAQVCGNSANSATWYEGLWNSGSPTTGVSFNGGFLNYNAGTGIDIGQSGNASSCLSIAINGVNLGTGSGTSWSDNINGNSCSDQVGNYVIGNATNPVLMNSCTTGNGPQLGGFSSALYKTNSVCQLGGATGTASPAACVAAASGKVAIPASQTTYTVDTSAVTANSIIIVVQTKDNSGLPSSPTCGTTAATPIQATSSAGTSFGITLTSIAQVTCFSYWVIN
jgi:hypothetical protein